MMSVQATVCDTLEVALEKALEMETDSFLTLLAATRRATHQGAKAVLHDTAADKLRLKTRLEEAMLEGGIDTAGLQDAAPTMNLDFLIGVKQLATSADTREALAYCIHLVSGAVDFYRDLGNSCAGAPMGPIFKRLGDDQSALLQKLETDYETHFLPEG